MKKYLVILAALVVLLAWAYLHLSKRTSNHKDFVSYHVDLRKQQLRLYWRDDKGQLFNTIGTLKKWLESKGERLAFAMNASMFKSDYSPQGLLIQEGKIITPLDTATGTGNFYRKPNGVFFVTADQRAVICATERFHTDRTIRDATQSGPMLLIEGEIHPAFQPRSANVNIRNGVGILPSGNIVFAMSKKEINFYDFAAYFKSLGCLSALYLDGFVSRTYAPEKNWAQTEGNLGVLIGVTAK